MIILVLCNQSSEICDSILDDVRTPQCVIDLLFPGYNFLSIEKKQHVLDDTTNMYQQQQLPITVSQQCFDNEPYLGWGWGGVGVGWGGGEGDHSMHSKYNVSYQLYTTRCLCQTVDNNIHIYSV